MINLTIVLPARNLDIPERHIPGIPLNIDLIDYHLLQVIDEVKRKYPESGELGEGYTKTVKSLTVLLVKVDNPGDDIYLLSVLDPTIISARYDNATYLRDVTGYCSRMCGVAPVGDAPDGVTREVCGKFFTVGWETEYDVYSQLENLEIDMLADYPRFRVAIGDMLDDVFTKGYEIVGSFQRTVLYENKDVLNSNYQLFISNMLVSWQGGVNVLPTVETALHLAGVTDLDFTQAATVPGFYVFSANDTEVVTQMLIGFGLIKRGLFSE